MFFSNKQRQIESKIEEYCRTVLECVAQCERAMGEHCRHPDRARAKEDFAAVHRMESRADDVRREIELMMYTKALFPESRGDVLGLLESMDKVPNQAEECVRSIHEQRIVVPAEQSDDMTELLGVCRECTSAMVDSVRKLFSDYASAAAAVSEIDKLESRADRIESRMKEAVFGSDADALDKIVLRDLITRVSNICDRAETAGDRIRIMVAKRGT